MRYFGEAFSLPFSEYHRAFWRWLFAIGFEKPDNSFVAVWPRATGKSSAAEVAMVALGARKRRKYGLYISSTQDQADDHVQTVGAWLESAELAVAYPALCDRALTKFGQVKGWRRNRLRCASGFTVDALGLDTAARGVKLEAQRPDIIWLDDIDGENDLPGLVEKKIRIITTRLIPTGADNVCIGVFQNLIHADSIVSRLVDGRADFLHDRFVSGPYPALRGFAYEVRDERPVITSGDPTWPEGMPVERCQDIIEDVGPTAFRTEYQHDVKGKYEGAVFPEWNELYHIITYSEFIRVYQGGCGCPYYVEGACRNWRIPSSFNLGRGHDWGTTQDHPSVVVWCAKPHERDPHNDCVFIYRELVRPFFPPTAVPFLVSPRKIASEIHGAERRWGEGARVSQSIMSHEASAAQNTYMDPEIPAGERVMFMKHQTGKFDAGIPQIQNALFIDLDRPHPFRRHPRTGQLLKGRPRLFVVVPDEEGELYMEGDIVKSRPAKSESGMARLRWEFPRYRYPTGTDGIEKRKPFKADDDAVDALRYLANVFFPRRFMKTKDELMEEALPYEYRKEQLNKLGPEALDRVLQPRQELLKELQKVNTHPFADVFETGSKNIS